MYPFDPTRPTLAELKERGFPVFDPWAVHNKSRDVMSPYVRSIDPPIPKPCDTNRKP